MYRRFTPALLHYLNFNTMNILFKRKHGINANVTTYWQYQLIEKNMYNVHVLSCKTKKM